MSALEDAVLDALVLDLAAMPSWWRDAACREVDADTFFPERGCQPTAALAVCDGCPVADLCLEYALEERMEFGVFGGMTIHARRKIAKDRGIVWQLPPAPRTCACGQPARQGRTRCRSCANRHWQASRE